MWIVRAVDNGLRYEVIEDAAGVVDSSSWLTSRAAEQRATMLNASTEAQEADALLAAGAPEGRPFYSVLCVDEYETADGRYFEHFEWASLPLPMLTLDGNEGGGHYGAEASASIRTIERLSDNRRIFATGFISTTEEGLQTEQQIEQQMLRFVSVDPADYDVEEEITVIGSDGWPIEGRLRFSNYVIGGATIVPFPAIRLGVIWLEGMDAPAEFSEPLPDPVARVQIPEIRDVSEDQDFIVIMASGAAPREWLPYGDEPMHQLAYVAEEREHRALLASGVSPGTCVLTDECGGPALPPAEWFEPPALSGPTRMTVTPEGRVYGHVALWGIPHRGFLNGSVSDQVYAPRSSNDYADFMTHTTPVACCAEAGCGHERVALQTGTLVLGAPHAGRRLTAAAAVAFYENTAHAAADVRCGEDADGIWVAGALRPGQDDARVRELLGAACSGDWRWKGGRLELCAVLMVNMEGFPIVASGHVEAGELVSLQMGWAPALEPDEALVASLARPQRTQERPRLPEGLVVVERTRLERLERHAELLEPLVAEALDHRVESLLAAP